MRFLRQFPLFILLMLLSALAMMVPAAHAAKLGDWFIARVFFQYGLLVAAIAFLIGVAMMNRTVKNASRSNLITLILSLSLLPVFLALPFQEVLPKLGFFAAYFEMVSSFTTTGATLFADPFRISESLHLWRGLVGWLGGFFILVVAMAILEPLKIGGFEMRETMHATPTTRAKQTENYVRLMRAVKILAPPYFVFTLILALLLIFSGERVFIATIHAMSTLSTSSISPVAGMSGAQSGLLGEILIAMFLVFAVSSKLMNINFVGQFKILPKDPEFQLALIVVIVVPLFLFVRHWLAALEIETAQNIEAGLGAIWGALFTSLSFLTTTGFESSYWHEAQSWSGLGAPGIILIGLAVMGGGVATTAGGIKLLRIYSLYKHGIREMDRLAYPSSVGRSGSATRRFRRQGAELAWVFSMLFLISLVVVALVLSLIGIEFENAFALAIATLTNTGPVYTALGDISAHYGTLSETALAILSVSMILGRVEALALIALLNPDYWRH